MARDDGRGFTKPQFITNLTDPMEKVTMSPDKTLIDPWRAFSEQWTDEVVAPVRVNGNTEEALSPVQASRGIESVLPEAHTNGRAERLDGAVPPVRTIVLDRPPTQVAPTHERDAIRSVAGAGPERLSLREVSIHYGAQRAVNSVSLSIHQGEVLALIG